MTGTSISRKILLLTVFVMVGIAGSGCGGGEERLTSPTKLAASLTPSSMPVSYTWEFEWTGNPWYCGATWQWLLADSSWAPGGQAPGCGAQPSPISGTGTVPPNAIAIEVSAGLAADFCNGSAMVMKPLNNNQSLAITVNAQLPNKVQLDPFGGPETKCPAASASISIHTR